MSEHAEHLDGAEHGGHHDINYVGVWVTLVLLLVVSVVGPMFEIQWLTLITAFGIACVKAYLVIRNFMHLTFEKPYILMLMGTMLLFVFLFVAGVSPDVRNHDGLNWNNHAAKAEVERALKQIEAGGGHGGGHH